VSARPLRVLVVEDDEAIASGLAMNLRIEGYEPLIEGDGEEALQRIRRDPPDMIVLDISLPSRNGLSVLSELRAAGDATPVIVLSARQEEFDKVAALRLGADDYVTKPFALAELLARIIAVLRRSGRGSLVPNGDVPADVDERGPAVNGEERRSTGVSDERRLHRFGTVTVDPATRTVDRAGVAVKLTHLELELLLFFLEHPAQVFSRDQLLREVWGVSHSGSARTVDNFVAQLRAKLEDDPEEPRHFVTVRGSGYRFDWGHVPGS
jgi:two-component system, OmpR family, alkaline phosphatase synthesis response regulator PhoP